MDLFCESSQSALDTPWKKKSLSLYILYIFSSNIRPLALTRCSILSVNVRFSAAAAIACTARAWRYAFESLIGDRISQKLEETVPLHAPYFLATDADFFALGLVLLLAGESAVRYKM